MQVYYIRKESTLTKSEKEQLDTYNKYLYPFQSSFGITNSKLFILFNLIYRKKSA